MKQIFVFLTLILYFSDCIILKDIEPDKTIRNEILRSDDIKFYQLINLGKDSLYELKISYPASIPTDFSIDILCHPSKKNDFDKFNTRDILNIEKIFIKTDKMGHIDNCIPNEIVKTENQYLARVKASLIGVTYDPKLKDSSVTYDIVLETLYFGLPLGAIHISIIFFIFLFLFCVTLYIYKDALNSYLHKDKRKD